MSGEYSGFNGGKSRLVLLLLIIFFGIIVLQTAWLCDDAYITFRTVDNFVNGHGLRWNVLDRVQTYTHPLWMFLISILYFFTGEIFFTALFISVFLSILAIWLLNYKVAIAPINAVVITLILVFSKAFIDFSTSGLENPLTHFMLALFFLFYFRMEKIGPEKRTPKDLFVLSLIASFAAINRMDILLILLPPLLYAVLKRPVDFSRIKSAIYGFAPFIIWELFALIYYGFLFPNTAVAKLRTGCGSFELIQQGLYYFMNSLSWDPLTLFAITVALIYTFFSRSLKRYDTFIAIGAVLYLLYIVRIGGDFMSGRFLCAPLFCSVVLLSRIRFPKETYIIPIVFVVLILGFRFFSPENTEKIDCRGVADERSYYRKNSSLSNACRHNTLPDSKAARIGKEVKKREGCVISCVGGIGHYGFFAGPTVHVVDNFAIGDPFLSRLPCRKPWRIGHYFRTIPKGYLESIRGENQIEDPSLAKYWSRLLIVIRGKLFCWDRFKEIWNFNSGKHKHLIKEYLSRKLPVLSYHQVDLFRETGTLVHSKKKIFDKGGIIIRIPYVSLIGPVFAISLNQNEKYRMIYLNKGVPVSIQEIRMPHTEPARQSVCWGFISSTAIQKRFDSIRIIPYSTRGKHMLGHFHIFDLFTIPCFRTFVF